MPKKLKFPEVPGDTPREQFENLVRRVISIPKTVKGRKIAPRKRIARET
jgi:hypothetical protein